MIIVLCIMWLSSNETTVNYALIYIELPSNYREDVKKERNLGTEDFNRLLFILYKTCHYTELQSLTVSGASADPCTKLDAEESCWCY
jgi:hypothetical protein